MVKLTEQVVSTMLMRISKSLGSCIFSRNRQTDAANVKSHDRKPNNTSRKNFFKSGPFVELVLEWQKNFCQIIFRIAFENHARSFHVNLARWQSDVDLPLVGLFENFRVAPAQLVV